MAPLTSTNTPVISGIGEVLSYLKLPNPIDWLQEVDGDPDDLEASAQSFSDSATELQAATQQMTGAQPPTWMDSAREAFDLMMDALVYGLTWLWEGFLYIVEWIVAIIEIIVTFFLFVVAIILFLLLALTVLVAVTVTICMALAASLFGSGLIPGVIMKAILVGANLFSASWVAALSTITLFATGITVILYGLKWLLSLFHDKLEEWRSGLLDYTGGTPDWDPQIPNPIPQPPLP